MHHNVTPEIKQLCDAVGEFIDKEVLPMEEEHHDLILSGEVNQEFFDLCRVVMDKSVKAGFFALYMPEDVGGGALGEYEMCLVREEVALRMSHLCMLMLGDLPFGPNKMLYHLASDHQKEKYLMPLMRGEVTSAIALTEPDAGSDLAAIRTSAKRAEGGYV